MVGKRLFIKGRIKTMLLTANGQNVYPEEIESRLNNLPYVAESVVVLTSVCLSRWSIRYGSARCDQITREKLDSIMQEKTGLHSTNRLPTTKKSAR